MIQEVTTDVFHSKVTKWTSEGSFHSYPAPGSFQTRPVRALWGKHFISHSRVPNLQESCPDLDSDRLTAEASRTGRSCQCSLCACRDPVPRSPNTRIAMGKGREKRKTFITAPDYNKTALHGHSLSHSQLQGQNGKGQEVSSTPLEHVNAANISRSLHSPSKSVKTKSDKFPTSLLYPGSAQSSESLAASPHHLL